MFDLLIRRGEIIDGTGAPSFRADVGITGDRIAAMGDLAEAESHLTLDLSTSSDHRQPSTAHPPPLVVAPGFIDVHTHSDVNLLVDPSAPNKIRQGVTTEVVGNCGTSAAPIAGRYRLPLSWAGLPLPEPWATVSEYRDRLDAARPAVNVVLLIGHNTLRGGTVGYDNRAATADELIGMESLLEQALDEGGRGLSSGLIYLPGMFAPQDELIRLAAVTARYDGIYSSHIRNEAGQLLAAVDEALLVGRESGARVQVSHLKAAGRANWPLAEKALERLRAARRDGQDAAADRYPYLAGETSLDIVFPGWLADGGRDAMLARLADPAACDRLRRELRELGGGRDWNGIIIGSTHHPDNRCFQGLRLPDVAAALDMSPEDAILYLARTDKLGTQAFFFGQSEKNMIDILAEPYVMIGSDASARSPDGPLGGGFPHPRGYGTFARFLRMSLDGRTVPVEDAIRKMTSLPADFFRLARRGRIAAGMIADIVIFNPATIRDRADYRDPQQFAEGIEHVIVNGTPTLLNGEFTGQRGGIFAE